MLIRLRHLLVAASLAMFAHTANAGFVSLYVFGDSVSDSGNDAVVIGTDPAQLITGNTYIPTRPYASGQFTNGDVWARDFASLLGLAPFGLPSLLGGGDFAFGGASVATDSAGVAPSLLNQVGQFLARTGGTAPPDALYVIAGGANDAQDALFAAANSPDPASVIGAAATAYAVATGNLVDELQAAGAQHIVVWDVPDIGKIPSVTALGSPASFLGTFVASSMNAELDARLAIEGASVSMFDIFALQNALIADPAAFGLVNVVDACGSPGVCDPTTGVFWDGLHPTAAAHQLIAEQLADQVSARVPEPPQLALTLSGLMLLACWMRRVRGAPSFGVRLRG